MLNAVKATKITSRYTPYHRRPSNLLRGITTAWLNNIHSNTTKVIVNVGVMGHGGGSPGPVRIICTLQLNPKPSNRSESTKKKKKKKVQKRRRRKKRKESKKKKNEKMKKKE